MGQVEGCAPVPLRQLDGSRPGVVLRLVSCRFSGRTAIGSTTCTGRPSWAGNLVRSAPCRAATASTARISATSSSGPDSRALKPTW